MKQNQNYSIRRVMLLAFFITSIQTQSWAFRAPQANEPDFEQYNQAKIEKQKQHAPDGLKKSKNIPEDLLGHPRTEQEVVRSLENYINSFSKSFGGLKSNDFRLKLVSIIPGLNNNSETAFVEFIQQKEFMDIEGSYLKFTVKILPKKSVILSTEHNLYPDMSLKAATPKESRKVRESAARAVKLDPLKVTERGEQRKIKFRNGQWHRVAEKHFKETDLKAVVDLDTAEGWMEDDRLFAIDGTVQGRGVQYDPFATGTNLPMLNLKDLKVRAFGFSADTDAAGNFSFPTLTSSTTLTASLIGLRANVTSRTSSNLVLNATATPGVAMPLLFNSIGTDELTTSQVNGYYHTTLIHDWLQSRLPSNLNGIDLSIPVYVNHDSTCNAYCDFNAINFYKSGGGCINTAFDTVIYHEYGHFADYKAGGLTDRGLSEGWGDIFSSFASNQPLIGKGFFGPGTYIRTAHNTYQYPPSGLDEVHELGQSWVGFAWHLRENLIASLGNAAGIAMAEKLILSTLLANSLNIPKAVKDVIILDDDDGNLLNGTPHLSDILKAANRHSIPVELFASISSPALNSTTSQDIGSLVISGTAPGQQYELAYGVSSRPTEWNVIGTFNASVQNGVLGTWPISMLSDNAYMLKLTVKLVTGGLVTFIQPIEITRHPAQPLVTNSYDQNFPAASGNRVVWVDRRNGRDEIYLYDFTTKTEQRVTTEAFDGSYKGHLAFSDNRIVYESDRNGNSDIYMFDLSTNTESRITTNLAKQHSPSISGNRIVWTDSRNGKYDIYLYDLSTKTERRITSGSYWSERPSISGDRIVWTETQSSTSGKIYVYDLMMNTKERLTNPLSDNVESDAMIEGDQVVWRDSRTNYAQIYLRNLKTGEERRLTSHNFPHYYPRISNNRVVYSDYRSGSFDIYVYNLSTNAESRLTTNPADKFTYTFSGDHVIWPDARNGNLDLYFVELPSSNIVLSSGFELGKVDWSGWGAPNKTLSNIAYAGIQSAKIIAGSSAARQLTHDIIMGIVPGQKYEITAQLKTESLTAPAYISIEWKKKGGGTIKTFVFGHTSGTTGGWKLINSKDSNNGADLIAPPEAVKLKVELITSAGTGNAYFDEVKMIKK